MGCYLWLGYLSSYIFLKKMKEIKNFNERERQKYVPASVKVIGVAARRVICTSPGSVNDPFGGTEEDI